MALHELIQHLDHPAAIGVGVASMVPMAGATDNFTLVCEGVGAVYFAVLTAKVVWEWIKGKGNAAGDGQHH